MTAEWSVENTRFVCELFAEQVHAGNRPGNYLTPNAFDEVTRQFKMRIGLDYTHVFFDLHDKLVAEYGLKETCLVTTYESLAMFLWTLGGCESNRRTQNRFKHGADTVHRKFHEVLHCVIKMASHYIKPQDPNFHIVHDRIKHDKRAYPHLKDCIGAIDGTHVRASIPEGSSKVRYIGRTGATTQNVMAVCDFDMHFTYASIGQPGSMHDTSVLFNAIENDKATFPHPPKGKYYLVDARYPNRDGYLAPYKGERSHVPDFQRGAPPTTPVEKFNRIHSSKRNTIERWQTTRLQYKR